LIRKCLQEAKPDVILNTAVISNIRKNEEVPDQARRINAPENFFRMLSEDEHFLQNGLLIHYSTDQRPHSFFLCLQARLSNSFGVFFLESFEKKAVFDGTKKGGHYVEEDVPNPLHVYGKTKLESEALLMKYLPHNHVVVRTTVIYGPEEILLLLILLL
jgi:dTDP-4-dehydrorhamnose reductase